MTTHDWLIPNVTSSGIYTYVFADLSLAKVLYFMTTHAWLIPNNVTSSGTLDFRGH